MKHANLSPSSAHRWMHCPASVRMESNMPYIPTLYAEEGIAAHALSELTLHNPEKNCIDYLNTQVNGFRADAEMCTAIQIYVDAVRAQNGTLLLEHKVNYTKWVTAGFGTVDAIVLDFENRTIYVNDLKYGKGVKINAKNNPQLQLYALGALDTFDHLCEFDKIIIGIYQPRLNWIDRQVLKVNQIQQFGENVRLAAKATEQKDAPFHPGTDQCQWCKAAAYCLALKTQSLAVIANEFDDLTTLEPKNVNTLSSEEVIKVLTYAKMITKWLKVIEARAIKSLEVGESIPGYKLVSGRSTRCWSDEELVERKLRNMHITVDKRFKKTLISVAQAEKLLSNKFKKLKEFVIKPPGKVTIVPEEDCRPAIEPAKTMGFDTVN